MATLAHFGFRRVQRTGFRRQKTEDRGQGSEDRKQRTEDRETKLSVFRPHPARSAQTHLSSQITVF
ncbi:MAG: hypothetical protein LBD06_13225 [Candidatus Accumulibacter sp.]|nr:hypothetical protein [Accumulibacter sp.]